MLEIKTDENTENEAPENGMEFIKEEIIPAVEENEIAAEENTTVTEEAAPEPPPPQPQTEQITEGTLNPLNEQENNTDSEAKTKHRRYWTPKEEERFHEIWGRENWRLTRHGKNTIFFAKWADEMRDRFNIDIKPEEIQCKVNQTRAKFRSVKKNLESDKNAVKWKKYDIIERILMNQYRSKDDEPVPLEALENNRDVALVDMHNSITQPPSPNSASNMSTITDQNINLVQTQNTDHQLTDEVNMSSASLSDQSFYCNNSQSANSFSTELFGSDQLEIKQEIENDLKQEGFTDPQITNQPATDDATSTNNGSVNNTTADQISLESLLILQQPPLSQSSSHVTENVANIDHAVIHSSNPNSLLIQSRVMQNNNININATTDSIVNFNNHANLNNNTMQPPKAVVITPSPRKRNRTTAHNAGVSSVVNDSLEASYLEEVRKRNILLVDQSEINRKRLRLEERKVKMMEEFFPKFMNLQQEILLKLENVTKPTTQLTN